MRIRSTLALLAATGLLAIALPATASAACSSPFTEYAIPNKDVHHGWAPGVGFRTYSVGISSYIKHCGNTSRIRHGIYINTSGFPHGYKFLFSVSTRNNKGRWVRARSRRGATIFELSGERKIQEVLLWQSRNTPPGTRITRVHVVHCACSPSSGAVPWSSTLKGIYKPYRGPEARPAP